MYFGNLGRFEKRNFERISFEIEQSTVKLGWLYSK
jgi:hypothetical protein